MPMFKCSTLEFDNSITIKRCNSSERSNKSRKNEKKNKGKRRKSKKFRKNTEKIKAEKNICREVMKKILKVFC